MSLLSHLLAPQTTTFLNGGSHDALANEHDFAKKFPLRIIVADDDYISRRTLRFMLEGLGYDVETVENGHECLAAMLAKPFDVVLLDLDMPVMDGIDCARAARAARINTIIVALTAVPVQIARLASLGAGINSYLEKPVVMDELKQALRVASFNHLGSK